MSEKYLVMSISFGEPRLEMLSKEELTDRLNPDEDGSNYYGNPKILTSIPNDFDWIQQQENSIIIFKGDIVVPIPVETVTKYQI